MVALVELYLVLRRNDYQPRLGIGITLALLLWGAASLHHLAPFDLTGAALATGLLLSLAAEVLAAHRTRALENWALTLGCACYVAWLLGHYILLRALPNSISGGWLAGLQIPAGAAWVYLVLLITWMQDTGAFLVGRQWGRHPMAPYLSPKKSWEGAAGGLAAAVLVALLAVPLFGLPLSYGGAALLGAAGALAGMAGDLAESLIKRQIGIKDMSNLLPGHGGILDRIDSMLFTAPVLYYLLLILLY
jgi:phosphatidate cytidylyltransferase